MIIQTITYDELREVVARQIKLNREATTEQPRSQESQRLLDQAIEAAYQEGEIHLASALLVLMAARIQKQEHLANQLLFQFAADNFSNIIRGEPSDN